MIPTALYLLYCFLATGMCQGFAGCRESYFLSNGECLPCPDHCVTCVSNTNCTKCTDNYYGVTCQEPCPESDCECHKTYGYCTYGCPDRLFPEEDSPQCSPCPDNCNLCSSASACVICKPRFYGVTCQKRCSTNCETCNKTTGNCLVCEEGYFNQGGQCLRCPEGCVGCYDNGICSRCKEGYLELDDGQCIGNCSMFMNGSFSSNVEHEEYTPYEVTTTACTCTKWQSDESGILLTKRPCIDYLACPPKFLCPAVDEDSFQCVAIRTYTCTPSCRPVNERYCECRPSKCKVVDRTPYGIYFCLKGLFSVMNVSITSECVPPIVDMPSEDPNLKFVVVGLLVLQLVMVLVLVLLVWKLRRRKMESQNSSNVEKGREHPTGNVENNSQPENEESSLLPQSSEDIPKIGTSVSLDGTDDNINNEESSDKCGVKYGGEKEPTHSRVKLSRSRSATDRSQCKSPQSIYSRESLRHVSYSTDNSKLSSGRSSGTSQYGSEISDRTKNKGCSQPLDAKDNRTKSAGGKRPYYRANVRRSQTVMAPYSTSRSVRY